MSEYQHNCPDRPITWTLASETPIKRLPNLSELWATWRKSQTESEAWKESVGYYDSRGGGSLPINRINTYFEMQEEPQL